MFAAAEPVQEFLGFGLGQLAVGHGGVQIRASVASPDLGQGGVEGGHVPGPAQPLGLLSGHPPRRHHPVEVLKHPPLFSTQLAATCLVIHVVTVTHIPPGGNGITGPETLRWHAGPVEIRQAGLTDETALKQIDAGTWTADSSPAPPPPPERPFFGERNQLANVLVAEDDGQVIGYVILRQSIPIPSHGDVLEINGLAVDPAHQGRGTGRQLLEACAEEARSRGARKLTLRVLGINDRARRLYESCGFHIEGVLRDEFYLGGRYVDDVLMARFLIVG
jgi:ribosomal protein S18 acetylase RimI-like enzyme